MSNGEFPAALHAAAEAMDAAYRARYAPTTPRQAAEAVSDFRAVPSALNEIAKALAQRAEQLGARDRNPNATDNQRAAADELTYHCYHLIRRSADTYRALDAVIDATWALEAASRGTNTKF